MQEIKFRLVNPRLKPRRTKLEMPGWAGKPEPRTDGSHEYAWHCVPFTEGAQYGIEIFYPYENELHVTKRMENSSSTEISALRPRATCNGRRSAASAGSFSPISFCSI
jgi:hypothetical protein